MKLLQQSAIFSPIAIVLESREEVNAFWDLITLGSHYCTDRQQDAMATKISDYLSNEAKI